MDIALTAELCQSLFSAPSNPNTPLDTAKIATEIQSLLGLASGAMIAAGEAFKLCKDNLSSARFSNWLDTNGFVSNDTNKLIKLFECFGNIFNDLTTVSPLSLIRLVAPKCEDARDALLDMVEEFREIKEVVTSQEVETIRKVHSPQPKKRAVSPKDENDVNESVIKMVGNQPGGTGIFRLEVKNHELANHLDTEWKQSGRSADNWMQFMSASTNKIQEIAQVVLGRKIVDVSELSQLDVVIDNSQSDNQFVGVELEIDDFGQVLPSQVLESLNKLHDLDKSIARCSNATAKIMYREERTEVLSQLETLAAEYQLDIESLIWRQHQELARC